MKRLLIAGAVLIVLLGLVFVMKGRQRTPPTDSTEVNSSTQAVDQFLATAPAATSVPPVEKAQALMAIDAFLEKHPSGPGVGELRHLSKVLRRRPNEPELLAAIATTSVEDGSISKEETILLKEAIVLAEKKSVSSQDVARLSQKHQRIQTAAPATQPVSNAQASVEIDRYIKKHPKGQGVTPLRRLSKALKARPQESQPVAATVVHRLGKGPLTKADSPMLEEAATLAEKEGLSPAEMAEFSNKYASGAGLAQKPKSAVMTEKKASERIPSFEGKRQLIYTFQGAVQCQPKACVNVRVRVHVSAGRWVEEREGSLNPQGAYTLQMPVMSMVHEKVVWQVEANDKDLRSAERHGERVTTADDKDITLQNTLILTAP